MSHFRIRWKILSQHVHARVFTAATKGGGYAMNGTLVFRADEWRAFQRCFDKSDMDTVAIIPEDDQP